MKYFKKRIPWVVWLVFFSLTTSAQGKLPDSFSGWETEGFQPLTAPRLAEFFGDDAALQLEYGFVLGERRNYRKNTASLTATLWKMRDASGSFGLFTFYRDTGTAGVEAQDRVAEGPNHLLIQRGLYVVEVRGAQLSMGEAKLLLAEVPRLREAENLLPVLPAYLPEENLVPQSPKYLMGPVAFERLEKDLPSSAIGFEMGAEAEMAQYRMDGNDLRLLLVSYATPQLAAKKFRSFQKLPPLSGEQSDTTVYIQRKGPLVCFVLDAPDPSMAQALLGQIEYESTVTWNEYVPTRRDNFAHLMLNIFMLAGFVLLFAFVAGLSFGGMRILAKKFLRVPIFDRPSQVEIIQLHLTDY